MTNVEMADLNASNTNGPPAVDANGPNPWHTDARAGCHPRGVAVAGDGLCKLSLCGQVVQLFYVQSVYHRPQDL